ncbi:MAG: hypothetical protein QM758_12685 [Armatimonas sp.]
MILPVFPIVSASYIQAERDLHTTTLLQKDKRLQAEVPARELKSGNFKNMATWLKDATELTIGTTEVEMFTTKDYFVFGKVRSGELMEAYSTLYRLRWVAYKSGKPHYELTLAKDQQDSIHLPKDDLHKQQSTAASSLIGLFDKLSDQDRGAVLSGTPLKYSELSPEMQQAFKNTLEASIDVLVSSRQNNNVTIQRPDTSILSDATFSLSDNSKPGSDMRTMWVSLNMKGAGFGFRWTDYDPKKNQLTTSRPSSFTQEPEANDKFSKKRMLQQSEKLTTLLVTVPKAERTLARLLKYISANYGINFITNEDSAKQTLAFACGDLPLASVLDKISQQYGEWEWEACPGDFIVMRSSESLRRRHPVPGND